MKVREMCMAALMTALICVVAPMAVPVGPVPVTLGTMMVYLAGALLGAKWGTASVALYLLLGAAGLPVFSGFEGGLQKVVGPTGGYMVGYLVCALVVGLAVERRGRRVWVYPASMIAGTVLLYALGTAWFMVQSGTGLLGALSLCVLPFLPGDAAKIVLASALGASLRDRVLKTAGRGAVGE